MGYAVYEDRWNADRWAGYAVPAECDMPDCHEKIDRGMGWQCQNHAVYNAEEDEYEEDTEGCYFYFCSEHLYDEESHEQAVAKGESAEWMWWLLVAPSWAQWRIENPEKVAEYRKAIEEVNYRPTQSNLVDLKWDMEDSGVMTTEHLL